jgi:5-carboxymethyl-2-hydroxymuconate isomerase
VADPQALRVLARVNGETMQDGTTAEMVFGVAEILAHCARAFTLLPGDLILTGTPPGVGAFRSPPVFLRAGDEVVVEVEGIGSLANPVGGPR